MLAQILWKTVILLDFSELRCFSTSQTSHSSVATIRSHALQSVMYLLRTPSSLAGALVFYLKLICRSRLLQLRQNLPNAVPFVGYIFKGRIEDLAVKKAVCDRSMRARESIKFLLFLRAFLLFPKNSYFLVGIEAFLLSNFFSKFDATYTSPIPLPILSNGNP